MSYRYISANDLVDKVDFETQNFINEMPCIYADIKPLNQHINIDEIRADERVKVLNEILGLKSQIYTWLIKREKGGYGTTLGECTDKIFEEIEKVFNSYK